MEFYILSDDAVDESFELVWTCQGVLRMPRKRPHRNKDGSLEHWVAPWEVPDYPKWSSIPGFPDFLYDPSKMNPGFVRPLTAEERRAHLAQAKEAPKMDERSPVLSFLAGSTCIRLGREVVRLSAREFELLSKTVEKRTLPRELASKLLEKVGAGSAQGVAGIVEYDALHGHRKAILRKVEASAGPPFKALLAAAFRGERRTFVYDESILPTRTE